MFGLSKVEQAIKLLREEYSFEAHEISRPLLNELKRLDGNAHDLAIFYVVGRARMSPLFDFEVQCQLAIAGSYVGEAKSDQTELVSIITAAQEFRRQREVEVFSEFESWFKLFREAAAEANHFLLADEKGTSLFDFMQRSEFEQSFLRQENPRDAGQRFGYGFQLPGN